MPDQYYEAPFGKSIVRRSGTDATIVANSYMVVEALKAADFLAKHGIEVEIVDPVSLVPLDENTILQSVRKTHRLLVVDTSWTNCGVSAEIAARVSEKAFDALTGPVRRMGMAPVVCPVARGLEEAFYPNAKTVAKTICEMLGREFPDDAEVPILTSQFKGPF